MADGLAGINIVDGHLFSVYKLCQLLTPAEAESEQSFFRPYNHIVPFLEQDLV